MLPTLVREFQQTTALFGVPFVPAGMEAFAKPKAKNVKNSFSLQVPPFSPQICNLFKWAFHPLLIFRWQELHIVRDDSVLRVLAISDLQYSFLSLSSLRMILEDLAHTTRQLQGTPSSRAKKVGLLACCEE